MSTSFEAPHYAAFSSLLLFRVFYYILSLYVLSLFIFTVDVFENIFITRFELNGHVQVYNLKGDASNVTATAADVRATL
jgi:hypothetical protein